MSRKKGIALSQCRDLSAATNQRAPWPENKFSRIINVIVTKLEVCLRVGAFDVGVLVFSAAAIFLASVHRKCLRYTEDVDVVFMKKKSSLFTLERGRWIRILCDSSNLHKQKLVKPKPLPSKMAGVKKVGQKNGEVGLLVENLFCDWGQYFPSTVEYVS